MRHPYAVAASAAALMTAMGGSGALARGTVTAPVADYNAAQVKTSNGAVTVPYGSTLPNAVYTVAPATQLEIGSRLTITLPSGFQFAQVPVVASAGGPVFTAVLGGVGNSSVNYQISGAAVPGNATIVIGNFSVTGAVALETGFENVSSMMFQVTNNVLAGNNDPAPIAVQAFSSEAGAQLNAVRMIGGAIDLTASPPGTRFVPNGATTVGSAEIGVVEIAPVTARNFFAAGTFPVLTPAGFPNTLSPTDSATITVSNADFSGIRTAYASPVADSCAQTVPGAAVTGTVTRHSVTFAEVPVGLPIQLCMIPDGTTLMIGAPPGASFAFSFTAGTSTDFLGGQTTVVGSSAFTYTGGTAQVASNFFTGSDAGYTSLLRVSNSGQGDAVVIAEFQDYQSGSIHIGSLGPLFAGTGTIFSLAQLEAAVPGLSLANSSQRATLTIIGTGTDSNISAAAIMVNPGGSLTTVP